MLSKLTVEKNRLRSLDTNIRSCLTFHIYCGLLLSGSTCAPIVSHTHLLPTAHHLCMNLDRLFKKVSCYCSGVRRQEYCKQKTAACPSPSSSSQLVQAHLLVDKLKIHLEFKRIRTSDLKSATAAVLIHLTHVRSIYWDASDQNDDLIDFKDSIMQNMIITWLKSVLNTPTFLSLTVHFQQGSIVPLITFESVKKWLMDVLVKSTVTLLLLLILVKEG